MAALAFDGPSAGEDVNAEYDFTLERGAAGWVAEVEGALTQGLVFIEPGLKVGSISPGFTFDVQGDPLRLHVAAGSGLPRRSRLSTASRYGEGQQRRFGVVCGVNLHLLLRQN